MYHLADGKPIMYEKSFMQDIAYQNFAKYDVKYRLKTPVVVSGVHACGHCAIHNVGRTYIEKKNSGNFGLVLLA